MTPPPKRNTTAGVTGFSPRERYGVYEKAVSSVNHSEAATRHNGNGTAPAPATNGTHNWSVLR